MYIISASPEEIVAPLALYLGVDEAIASRAKLDDEGRYTGEVEFYSYGPFKADAIVEAARLHDIDLAASYAYSDSATDLPMLEIVGHPVVVNPDRELARIARDARVGGPPVPPRGAAPRAGQHAAAGPRRPPDWPAWRCWSPAWRVGWWLWRRRACAPDGRTRARRPATSGRGRPGSQGALSWFGGQASCSFFTAKAARARTTMRTRSFFMGGSIGRAPGALSRASKSL